MNFMPNENSIFDELKSASDEVGRPLTVKEITESIEHFRALHGMALAREQKGEMPAWNASEEEKLSSEELSIILEGLNESRNAAIQAELDKIASNTPKKEVEEPIETVEDLTDMINHFRTLRSKAMRRELRGEEIPDDATEEEKLSSFELADIISGLVAKRNEAIKAGNRRAAEAEKRANENARLAVIKKQQEEKARADSLEQAERDRVKELTSMELPLDWENLYANDERVKNIHTDSIHDALTLSLANLTRVDIEYIASITGESLKTVILSLKGSIYQNPELWDECFYKGWETAEEYLSGNLLHKRRVADEANKKYYGYFADNLTAIDAVMPAPLSMGDIYVSIGSPWVPPDIIDDFITHILRLKNPYVGTKHDEVTGTWEIPMKNDWRYSTSVAATKTYGTSKMPALHILERTLNMKNVTVTDQSFDPFTLKKTRVVNKNETLLAIEKQQEMLNAFRGWVWKDQSRRQRLEEIYVSKYGCLRRRMFDGSFLQFPNMAGGITLYPYQKNAIARIFFSPNTLLAHDVGSGKTYIMIAAGIELKRLGISKKNLYVVPNNIVGQWASLFKTLYPASNILTVTPSRFTPAKRQSTLMQIRDGDYDAIIMPYSCFDAIPLSLDYYIDTTKEEKAELERLNKNQKTSTPNVRARLKAVSERLAKLELEQKNPAEIYFDSLGISRLFVDEAHNYKNIPILTQSHVLGITSSGSKKCKEMLEKVHFIQRTNDGGGVVFATGTPITNSITDVFTMQKYLQSGDLALMDLQSFDSWIGMFAEKVTEFEIDVDTNSYRLASRFSKFHNLPELTSMLSYIADFHQVDKSSGIPDFDGYDDALIPKTDKLAKYLSEISKRAEMVREHKVKRKKDNMLLITTDGRKAALDLRLVERKAPFTVNSKVAVCAENICYIYKQTEKARLTQLVFCDSSTPKPEFNMYDELKRLLVSMGVAESDIAYVHDAESERGRSLLFSKMRKGDIRILIGSTFKLGIGVNVQDKLIALHHLDLPWRPADMTQREGRILRQGNTNQRVLIYRYITEGSFDAYSWQLLETKQRFINDLLAGSLSERHGEDIENTVLNYAEVKALAIGNPLIKTRVETANELNRLLSLQRKAVENRMELEKEQLELPGKINRQKELITKCRIDIAHYEDCYTEHTPEINKSIREALHEAVMGNILVPEESFLMQYQGFDIILPSNMTETKPFIWLQNSGRYYIELGESDKGMLIRIDNFLNNLKKHLKNLSDVLEHFRTREQHVREELEKTESYTDKIAECKKKLEQLDKKLGVGEKKKK